MKREDGVSMPVVVIVITAIIAIAVGVFIWYKNGAEIKRNDKIKSDMLLIQGECKILKQNMVALGKSDGQVGFKLSDNNNSIIAEFKKSGVIPESEFDKCYILNDDILKQMNIGVDNLENAFYIVNYDTAEVYITCGVDGKYKLSEMSIVEKVEE